MGVSVWLVGLQKAVEADSSWKKKKKNREEAMNSVESCDWSNGAITSGQTADAAEIKE